MALNYIVNFGDRDGTLYRIEIDNPDYTGDPIELMPNNTPLIISWEGNNDDDIFKAHVIPSTITIGVVSTGLDFDTLFYINDASFKTRVYRSDELYWSGYLISDGIQEIDSGIPFDVSLTAIDGLGTLEGITFIGDTSPNPYALIQTDGVLTSQTTPMYSLRYVLFWEQMLGNRLPIRWNSSLKNDTYPTSDMLSGMTELGSLFYILQREIDAGKFTTDVLKSAQSWLYQKSGAWYINRYFDDASGTFSGKQITTNTETVEVSTTYDEDELIELSPSDTINESWYWFGKKPLSNISVTYDNLTFNEENNIVPDGNFLYMRGWRTTENEAAINQQGSITERNDSMSVEVTNASDFGDYLTFGEIPIDTDILYKTCQIGLKWMPISGYTLTTGGDIDFSQYPIHISIKLTIGANEYYLNEFGYWSDKNSQANAEITGLITIIPLGGRGIRFNPLRNFFVGDKVNIIYYTGSNPSNLTQHVFTYTFNTVLDVTSGVDLLVSLIPNSQRTTASGDVVLNLDDATESGSNITVASMSKADNYYRELQLNAGSNFRPLDVIDFQFVSRGSSGDIKIPSGKGFLSFDIWSKPNSVMRVADVFFRVPKNNDVYNISIPDGRNPKENYSMGISSGWSGNQVSSYGNSYETTDESELCNGGKTLTRLYGEAVMSVRNRPCRVFSGTIDRQMEWSMFSLMGHVYAPLSMRVNIKDKTTEVVGVEFAPSSPIGGYVVEHKSSGD